MSSQKDASYKIKDYTDKSISVWPSAANRKYKKKKKNMKEQSNFLS
ncbi:hypothetical protein MHTCC0001_37080 [Flavobacteriaceae bacterium MHTCC 0001]